MSSHQTDQIRNFSVKRIFTLLLILALLLSGCAAPPPSPPSDTVNFTDSTGRTVAVPANITRIAISGPLSQVYIIPLAGDLLVGVSNAFSSDAELYLPDYIMTAPELGQLYGGKGEMDLEALLVAAPDVVIDIGETKSSTKEDLQALTDQTGIPFIHIFATVDTAPEAYRQLGKLLGREEKAEQLAQWCENTLADIADLMARVDADGARKGILYCLGDAGVNVMAKGSFHADTINTMGNNLAVIGDVVPHGNGNETDLEQILLWDPEVILFDPASIYSEVASMDGWQAVTAVRTGRYYEAPYGPYGWLSSPPAVQRYLGLLWLGQVLYPEYVEYDLKTEVKEYYRLFYGCDLTDAMYNDLMANALDK